MYIIKPFNLTTGDIYENKVAVTSNMEEAQWVKDQLTQRGIGCVVRDTTTGAEW